MRSIDAFVLETGKRVARGARTPESESNFLSKCERFGDIRFQQVVRAISSAESSQMSIVPRSALSGERSEHLVKPNFPSLFLAIVETIYDFRHAQFIRDLSISKRIPLITNSTSDLELIFSSSEGSFHGFCLLRESIF